MQSLDQLKQITQALYLKEQAAIKDLLAEEARLRAELARLAAQVKEAQSSDGDILPMRSIGADVIWLGWVGRSKARLNIKLAQVLARKEQSIGKLRKAFGKKMVVEQLLKDSRTKIKRDGEAASLLRATEQALETLRRD